ncbi:hypothetical protein [Streptomyces iconiensis]|uniref:Uncharacterized protein n=1 Tax=Streptomyces iconiensis TaxID=1384038 RepID=A0ABT6ZZD0_9ACTN|nr:hypothetical protein [Streptomyces iconiensis]MDJ1133976.1 hypothetical protein [Streptomyces iconiensis]
MIHRIEPAGVHGVPDLAGQVSLPARRYPALLGGRPVLDGEGRVAGEDGHPARERQPARGPRSARHRADPVPGSPGVRRQVIAAGPDRGTEQRR